MRGIAAVTRIPRKQWPVAEVFPPFPAIPAVSAGLAKPGDTDAPAYFKRVETAANPVDPSDDFVAGNDRKLRIWQFAVDDVKVSAAHAAGGDANPHLTVARLRIGPLHKLERLARSFQHHCMHVILAFSRIVSPAPPRSSGISRHNVTTDCIQPLGSRLRVVMRLRPCSFESVTRQKQGTIRRLPQR